MMYGQPHFILSRMREAELDRYLAAKQQQHPERGNTTTMSNTTAVPTKTYTAIALDAELGRRRNNRKRDTKVRARPFVFTALSRTDIAAIKAGEVVTVEFASGRVEHVGLKV